MEPLIVSRRYRWYGSSDEIEDVDTNSRSSAHSYDAKVNVYEDRVRSWFLDLALAHTTSGDRAGDYVAVAVALAYIEGVEQYRTGDSDRQLGKPRFINSATRIFPSASPDAITRLYAEARCGLFHSGFTDGPTILSYEREAALEVDGRFLRINPGKFVQCAVEDFRRYVASLREEPDGDLAARFVTLWDRRWEYS